MGVFATLARLDSSMQRGMDNAMARVFGGRVVPEEIEELLKQETQDNLARADDGGLYAPNVLTVAVGSKDIENLSRDRQLPAELSGQVSRFIRNKGWALAGPVVVRIAEESGLRTGQLRVSSFIEPQPEEESGFDAIFHEPGQENQMSNPHGENPEVHAEAATTAFRAHRVPNPDDTSGPSVNLLLQDGSSRTYQVHEGSNIIGRANDADLRLPDTGVSRHHAEITWNGSDAVLVDLQSTNGTTVNDTPIENWLLADGDVITMGHSHIEVRITGLEN
ncbi:signal peptide protein [Corynebacterium phocae]|uniref:Signal peptide protein n=1 Tax=Corynebacterium phocae TaxID=161895 RepID=A0A1L7D0K6_9CORY|nr:DUF3662 and FHA domain-containing protein [Corynebacterium phocae]APT91608.1 signal peptide protein [Corynebacterium phocae]KAA8720678.1 DUF2662 domain-containing protein [Corynebacterium phocae]